MIQNIKVQYFFFKWMIIKKDSWKVVLQTSQFEFPKKDMRDAFI